MANTPYYSKAETDALLSSIASGFRASIDLTTASPTLSGIYVPTESGTYTNFGGIVVDLTEGFTVITFDGVNYASQVVPIDLANYLQLDVLDLDLANYLKTVVIPNDKSADTYSLFVDATYYYGQKSCSYNPNFSSFKSLKVKNSVAGNLEIAFVSLSGTTSTIVHTATVAVAGTGVNTIPASALSIPDLSAYSIIYVMVGNVVYPNGVAMYRSITAQTDGFASPKVGGTIVETTLVKRVNASFWIEVETSSDWQLTNKVVGINNFPSLLKAVNDGVKEIKIAPNTTITCTSTLNIQAGQKIYGSGFSSVLQAESGNTIVIWGEDVDGWEVSNLTIKGTFASVDINSSSIIADKAAANANTNRGLNYGIFSNLCDNVLIHDLWVSNFDADAILIRRTGYVSGNIFPAGHKVYNIFADNCYRALHSDTTAEYSQYHNITIRKCLNAAIIRGGNIIATNFLCTDNRLGMIYSGTSSSNNAHGIISNSSANHSVLQGLAVIDVSLGQVFSGFTVYFGGVTIENSRGIVWNGGQFGSADITLSGNTGVNTITNLMFAQSTSEILGDFTSLVLKNNNYIDGSSNAGINN